MKKKIVSMITIAALAALALAGCTEKTGEAEVIYKVVGGISEPTRVWNEVVETPEVEVAEEEAYAPDVLPMEPTAFVTNKTADTLTSDKDGEVIATLEEGTELTLVGTTGKGYYQTEDGAFISASDVEKVVAEEEPVEQVAETTTQSNTTPATTTTTPAEQPTQQTEQPSQEQQSEPVQEQQPTYEEPAQTAEAPAEEWQEPVSTSNENGWGGVSEEEAEQISASCPHTHTAVEECVNLATGEIWYQTVCQDCGAGL